MNIQHFIIIRKLLLHLKDQYPNERMQELDPSYQKLLSKFELLDIIQIMTRGGSHPGSVPKVGEEFNWKKLSL